MVTRVRTSKGITTTKTQIRPSGQVTISKFYANSMSYSDRSKETAEKPLFVPGVFNVKPYRVREFQTDDRPFECKHKTTRKSDGLVTITSIKGHSGVDEGLFSFMDLTLPNYDAELSLAMQEAYGKVNGAVWDLGVDLAELKELKGLEPSLTRGPRNFFDLLNEVYDASKKYEVEDARELKNISDHYDSEKNKRSARKDVKTRAKSMPKELASLWLVYRYGVMPTLLSINDALELMRKKLQLASGSIHTARRRKTFSMQKTQLATTQKNIMIKYDVRSRIEAIVYYRRSVDQTTLDQLGFIPENIPSILWETTRLSFVWDWVLHIGSFLEALKPKYGIEILGYTGSVKHQVANELTQYFACWNDETRKYDLVPTNSVTFYGRSFERSVDGGPKPYPVFTGLRYMNLERTLDSLALLFNPICKKIKKHRLL